MRNAKNAKPVLGAGQAAAEWAEGQSDTVTLLPPTLLYLLSSSRIPAESRDAILARVDAGQANMNALGVSMDDLHNGN